MMKLAESHNTANPIVETSSQTSVRLSETQAGQTKDMDGKICSWKTGFQCIRMQIWVLTKVVLTIRYV